MKKVFACLSALVLMLVAFGLAMNPVAVSAAGVADGKFIEDPTLEEGDIPMYIMNSIYTTFPTLYDNEAKADPDHSTGRLFYWNEIKLVIPQFSAEGPTGQRYTVYSQGAYSEELESAAGTKVYLWTLDEEGNPVTSTKTRSGKPDYTSTYGPQFGDVSLSGIRYNVSGKEVVINDLHKERGITNGDGGTDPFFLVFDGNGKAVRGHNHGNYVDAANIETYGYATLLGYKDGQIVVIEDVAGAADINGNSAAQADLDVKKVTVDDLDNPLLDPVTGEQLTDDEGNPLYNQKEEDDPSGAKQVLTGKRWIWQWYSEEDFAEVKVNTVPYMAEGWLADRWDYAYPDQNGGYICIAITSSLGNNAKISAEEAAIHNASVDALVAAGEEAPAKIEETETPNEDGTTTITYGEYRRPVVISVVIPVDGIMYRFGYLEYTGKPAVPLYMEKFNPLWEQAFLYGRNPEYQAYARTYNFSGQGLVETNAVVNGDSFIVRNENGKLVVEVKKGATLDISELIEITGMLGGYAVAGKPAPEAGSNVAAVTTYKNADVSELSYVLDIDGQHIMWAEKFKYETVQQAAAEFKAAMEAAFGGAFSNWSGNANIFKLFTESDEWDWVLDYWTAVNTNEYDGKKNADMFQALKNGDTTIDPYFIAVEANSFSKLTESAVYSSALKSANYGNADVQEAIWEYMPAPEPYKFESFDLFVDEFIKDYGTWAAEFCAANNKTFVTLVDGVPTFSGDGKAITRINWSNAMENVVGNANWKYTSFFEDERFAEKWSWFIDFWNEQITTTPKADGSAYTYTIDNKFAWRQALQAYFTAEYWGSWPYSPDFSGRSETPYWVGINEVCPTWEDAQFALGEAYDVHDRIELTLEVTNKATGFVDSLAMEFVVVEDYTPLLQVNASALEELQNAIYGGATAIDLSKALVAYDGYYDAREDNVYGHDISRHIEWTLPEGFDPANLKAGKWTIKARIESQVNGANKAAEAEFVVIVPDMEAPAIKTLNNGVIYVPVGTPITAEMVLQYAYDNADGDYLNDCKVYHNWFALESDYDPLLAAVYDEYEGVVSVTDSNGIKSQAKVTIIVTGTYVDVEMPEFPEFPDVEGIVKDALDEKFPDDGTGSNTGTSTSQGGCVSFAYVSSFIAVAGLALLVFKKRH